MRAVSFCWLLLTFALALPAVAAEAPAPATTLTAPPAPPETTVKAGVQDLRVEATAFLRYGASVTGKGTDLAPYQYTSSFELWRLYLGLRGRLSPMVSFRFTVDAGPESKSTTTEDLTDGHTHEDANSPRAGLYVKYAWLDFQLMKDLLLRAGIINNPFSDVIDGLGGVRYVVRNVGDEFGYYATADTGLRTEWVPKNLPVDLGLGLVNGTGYKQVVDNDDRKNIWATVRVRPMYRSRAPGEGLELWFYANFIRVDNRTEALPTYSTLLTWKTPTLALGYQFLIQDLGDRVSDTTLWDSLTGSDKPFEWDRIHVLFATWNAHRYAKLFGRLATVQRPFRDRVANVTFTDALANADMVLGYAIPWSKNLETAISYRLYTAHERVKETRFFYLSVLATF
jgi:hypothetical protein